MSEKITKLCQAQPLWQGLLNAYLNGKQVGSTTYTVSNNQCTAPLKTSYHTDGSGSTVLATTATGAILWKEHYSPLGERQVKSSTSIKNSQYFHGKEQDTTTGLQYFGARWYDPAIGRFMAVDPAAVDAEDEGDSGLVHEFNRYAFVANNPHKYVDPDGRNPLAALGVIATHMATGAIVGGASSGATNAGMQLYETGSVNWDGPNGVKAATGEGAFIGAILGPIGGGGAGVMRNVVSNSAKAGVNTGKQNARANTESRPSSRSAINADLQFKGFEFKGISQGGYATYKHPDGRIVTIKPSGEVIPTQPRVSQEGKKYNERTDYDFNRLDDQSHSTGHFVEPVNK